MEEGRGRDGQTALLSRNCPTGFNTYSMQRAHGYRAAQSKEGRERELLLSMNWTGLGCSTGEREMVQFDAI